MAGETVETVADFILGGSKITADVDCFPEISDLLVGTMPPRVLSAFILFILNISCFLGAPNEYIHLVRKEKI